jgi:DNA-binding CsgD family transcriptional regulator
MRNLSGKFNLSYILYVAIACLGFSFIAFLGLGREWTHYLVVNTLMMGAFGVYDLFWWSILGNMLEYDKNPAKILGIGLAANVLGVFSGGLFESVFAAFGSAQNYILLVFGIVCVTLVMLPPLNNRLSKLIKNHAYLTALAEMPEKKQMQLIHGFDLTEPLTTRENEVMRLLIQGKTYKAIADELYLSVNTVGTHARNIYAKAGIANRTELMNLLLKTPNSHSESE